MKTKTLLIAAATLAATVISSQAQSNVYSANIVGYANVVINGGGYTQIANPLNAASNSIANVVTLQGGEVIYIWNQGTNNDVGYYVYVYEAGAQSGGYGPSDWIDGGGVTIPNDLGDPQGLGMGNFVTSPVLAPGQAAFVYEPNSTFTNTFVGTVITSNTNNPTRISGGGYSLISSAVPVSGDLQTNSATALPLQGGEIVYVWNQGTNNDVGYYVYVYEAGAQSGGYGPSDWIDGGGVTIPNDLGDPQGLGMGNFVNAPQIGIGRSVFIYNPNQTVYWTNNIVVQ